MKIECNRYEKDEDSSINLESDKKQKQMNARSVITCRERKEDEVCMRREKRKINDCITRVWLRYHVKNIKCMPLKRNKA
jgi:sulfur transfer protein SufE